jgi:hypothetical protein
MLPNIPEECNPLLSFQGLGLYIFLHIASAGIDDDDGISQRKIYLPQRKVSKKQLQRKYQDGKQAGYCVSPDKGKQKQHVPKA